VTLVEISFRIHILDEIQVKLDPQDLALKFNERYLASSICSEVRKSIELVRSKATKNNDNTNDHPQVGQVSKIFQFATLCARTWKATLRDLPVMYHYSIINFLKVISNVSSTGHCSIGRSHLLSTK
jgi:hypothetical protein